MKRLLVNDMLTAIPGTRTFWHELQDWFDMEFVGGDFLKLADVEMPDDATLIIRNGTWFGKLNTKAPTISLIQDIFEDGPVREMQEVVIKSSYTVAYNSSFTASKYPRNTRTAGVLDPYTQLAVTDAIIPLPVDFDLFQPGNPMGLQQALSLPDNCVCWIGASEGAAGQIKGYDTFLTIVRTNPDINFVAVFKDAIPHSIPPNMRAYCRVKQQELVKIIGACRVGLCTSRIESQHLAGIEMGACGLSMVVPPVGVYYELKDAPILLVSEHTIEAFTEAIRGRLTVLDSHSVPSSPQDIRDYWKHSFSIPVIKEKWVALVKEVECSGQS